MTVETHVDDAIDRVDREREHFEDRLSGVEAFERELRGLQPTAGQPGGPPATDGGVGAISPAVRSNSSSQCSTVRELFAETIYPHSSSEGDESLLETIGEELGQPVSVALAPGTDQQFTPPLKRTILSATADRQAEIESMLHALDSERDSLVSARDEIQQITTWLCEADQTSLLQLNFEALRDRHEVLEGHLERCGQLEASRQDHIHGTTSQAGAAGVDHHQLVQFLYQSFPVSYPVLATLTNLEEVCRTGQRRVRDHLVRRA